LLRRDASPPTPEHDDAPHVTGPRDEEGAGCFTGPARPTVEASGPGTDYGASVTPLDAFCGSRVGRTTKSAALLSES
jgi:hypothetical protein